MGGFFGMNMAQGMGGMNAGNLYAMGQQQPAPQTAQTRWTCACGKSGNTGKFCMECGSPKPSAAPLYRCDKCGWEPEDPAHPPKFCPECGDVFDENDRK